MAETKNDYLQNMTAYAWRLYKDCAALDKKIDGEPTKEQVAALKATFDNVQLWMEALQE